MAHDADTTKDEIKGRVKEAAGAITGNDDLRESGENDQRAADVKGHIDDAADTVKDGVDSVTDKLSDS